MRLGSAPPGCGASRAWHSKAAINEINKIISLAELSMSRKELLQTRRVLVTMLQFLDRCIDTSRDAAVPTHKT